VVVLCPPCALLAPRRSRAVHRVDAALLQRGHDVRRPQDAPPAFRSIAAQRRRLAGLVDERREEVVRRQRDEPDDVVGGRGARFPHVIPHDVRGQRRLVVPRPINELREALVLVGAVEIFVLVTIFSLGVLRRARRRHAVRLRGLARRVRLLREVERLDGRLRRAFRGRVLPRRRRGRGRGRVCSYCGHHLGDLFARRAAMRALRSEGTGARGGLCMRS
ncbi:unnamed protein product, partial [Pelagomonas calceolata]